MKPRQHWTLLLLIYSFAFTVSYAQQAVPAKVRADFQSLLQRERVAPNVTSVITRTDSVIIEKGSFNSEQDEKVPFVIYKPIAPASKKSPIVICLHGTGGNKENGEIKQLLDRFVKAGFMAMSIDGRYHGERATAGPGHNSYEEAIIKAWKNTDTTNQQHPFYYDTVYDLWRLVDYLVTRPDIDSTRIGMMGISKGGIETWMAASVDTRIKVAVPVIAVQSFQWSLENDRWRGRAHTIWSAHVQAAKDLGDTAVNQHNIKIFWNKLLPGITGEFDCPSMIRLFAPRPLLILNTENDPNNPLPGARIAFEAATASYKTAGATDKLKIDVASNEGHRFVPKHVDMAVNWFLKWL